MDVDTANAKFLGKSQTLNPGTQKTYRIEQGLDRSTPCSGLCRGYTQGRDLFDHIGGKAEKTVGLFSGGEQAKKKPGQVGIFPGSGEQVTQYSIEKFGDKPTVGGEARLGEESDALGLLQDGFHRLDIGALNLRRGFEDGEEYPLAAPVGRAGILGGGLDSQRVHDLCVWNPRPGHQLDESVQLRM